MLELSTRLCARSKRRSRDDPGGEGAGGAAPRGRPRARASAEAEPLRHGVRLAVDPGDARVGVARSDPAAILATPVRTLRRGAGDVDEIAALVAELDACEVVVGYPASLSGAEGPAARKARAYAATLARRLAPVPVRLVDERLTTATARNQLLSGASHSKRGARGGRDRRSVVDQAAATVLLQGALDAERQTGTPPGELVGLQRP